MSEIGLAIGAVILAFLLGRMRRARIAKSILSQWDQAGAVSLEDMGQLIDELAPTLREVAKVTSPQSLPDRGHIWSSPCGKRVYIN